MNAYITPPGAQGLALHADPHDVFVLQAFGRKHWEVHAAPGEPEREPIEADVGPGDCIYMPTGTPHAATTGTRLSGHLTVGIHVTPWRDVLADVWRSLETDPALDDALPVGWTEDPSGSPSRVTVAPADLRASLDRRGRRRGDRRDAIRRFLSTRAQSLRGVLVHRRRSARSTTAPCSRVVPGSVCELRRDGEIAHRAPGRPPAGDARLVGARDAEVASADTLTVRDLTRYSPTRRRDWSSRGVWSARAAPDRHPVGRR